MVEQQRSNATTLEHRGSDTRTVDHDVGARASADAPGMASGPGLVPAQVLSRRTVASYRTYAEAERAIDHLADRAFPIHRTAIVGEGINLVEQITGRLGYGRAALNGAVSAAVAGAFFGFVFGLFNWITPILSGLTLALYGLLYGGLIGAVFGLVVHAMSGGRRDFTSASGFRADRYSVMVDQEVADEAARILQSTR